jgi:hypothetical protein
MYKEKLGFQRKKCRQIEKGRRSSIKRSGIAFHNEPSFKDSGEPENLGMTTKKIHPQAEWNSGKT